ncbi:pol [Symbiodinium microadriaticum]|nr:pol [Symbiodinium microadriaticum]
MGAFEQNVTHQFADTFQRLARVEHETEHTKEKVTGVENHIDSLAARVTRLEQAGPSEGHAQGGDSRPPALIIGGWHPDTEADKVIDHANKLVAELRLDLDMRGTFVPGVRRGYAIIPLTRKDGETQEGQRTRVQHCISQVRNANVTISTRLSGEPSKLFLNVSQPPEKRRKVQVAAKCKRLLMELGALASDVETEYSTGQVWFKSKKVKSASNHMAPQGTTQTGSEGWIDLQTIATKLHRNLEAVQEIIVEVGRFFDDNGSWTLLAGKKAGEWRGTAVAFKSTFAHSSGTVHHRACSVVLSDGKTTMGVLSGHIPHHATVEETQQILGDWEDSKAMLQHKLIVGMDANEVFHQSENTPGFPKGNTARGEVILQWMAEHSLLFPPQELHKPTYFPYSGQTPRRLDYLVVRKYQMHEGQVGEHRERAFSDHEPVLGSLPSTRPPVRTVQHWGPRHLKQGFRDCLDAPQPHGDPHHQLAAITIQMTKPGRDMEKYKESPTLRRARREAQTTPPGPDRKAAWKRVQALANAEKKAWHTKLHEAASKRDWRAYRAQKQLLRTREWEHYLLDDSNWQGALKTHFEGIFKKEEANTVARHIANKKAQLERYCKTTRWIPFTIEELQVTQAKWPRRKAAGPDGIVHEALFFLMQDDLWSHHILYILNDTLYRGTLPELLEKGVTILLPKNPTPATWSDTRPITISSSMLKWLAQLLLRRTQHLLAPLCKLQWCAKNRQSVEMLLAIRKIARMARDWGGPFIIVKLDVKKAFDTASQRSMGDLIADQIGAQGHPWEARVWLSLLHAKGMDVQFGGTNVLITQTNVRQGGPDSPVVFSALIGDTLLKTAERVTADPKGPDPRLPPPPHHTAGYMDDVYMWGENPRYVQEILTVLESILAEHGLFINHLKTCAIANKGQHTLRIAGHAVETQGPNNPIMVLGSPVSFAGGPAFLTAELATRARKAFYGNKKTLCAKTKLESRIKAHNVIVREADHDGPPPKARGTLARVEHQVEHQGTRGDLEPVGQPGNTRTADQLYTPANPANLTHDAEEAEAGNQPPPEEAQKREQRHNCHTRLTQQQPETQRLHNTGKQQRAQRCQQQKTPAAEEQPANQGPPSREADSPHLRSQHPTAADRREQPHTSRRSKPRSPDTQTTSPPEEVLTLRQRGTQQGTQQEAETTGKATHHHTNTALKTHT